LKRVQPDAQRRIDLFSARSRFVGLPLFFRIRTAAAAALEFVQVLGADDGAPETKAKENKSRQNQKYRQNGIVTRPFQERGDMLSDMAEVHLYFLSCPALKNQHNTFADFKGFSAHND
jgi:hypothetical protein